VGFHTGNWELLNNATARCAEYAVVVRRQKSGGLHRFISELRTATGALLIPEDRPQGLISALKRGMICAVLFDHGSRNARLYATLFDKQVPVPEGVFRLARTFNRPLVPAAAHRDEKGRMCVRLFDPLTVVSSQDFSACAEHLHRLY